MTPNLYLLPTLLARLFFSVKPSRCLYLYLTNEKPEAQQEVVMYMPKDTTTEQLSRDLNWIPES